MVIVVTAILYIASVTALILTRVGVLQWGKIFFKVMSSLLFIALWVVFVTGSHPDSFDYMILICLTLYMTGDVLFAVYRSKKGFIAGMSAFMAGNIIMLILLILKTGVNVWDVGILVLLLIISAVSLGICRLNYGGVGIIIAIYIGILCVLVTKAISVTWSESGFSIPALLFAAGAFLYGVSDIVLANNKFKYRDSRWLSPLNLGLYYSGIGLIAIFSTFIW